MCNLVSAPDEPQRPILFYTLHVYPLPGAAYSPLHIACVIHHLHSTPMCGTFRSTHVMCPPPPSVPGCALHISCVMSHQPLSAMCGASATTHCMCTITYGLIHMLCVKAQTHSRPPESTSPTTHVMCSGNRPSLLKSAILESTFSENGRAHTHAMCSIYHNARHRLSCEYPG